MSGPAEAVTARGGIALPLRREPWPSRWIAHEWGLSIAYIVVASVLAVLFFLLPDLHLVLWLPMGLLSVAATVIGVRRYRPRRAAAWLLLAGAQFTLIAGDTTYNVLTLVLGQDGPFPSVADFFYLLTYPLAAAGIFLFIRGRSASRDWASVIDAVIITTGLGLLSWVYLILPNFQTEGLSPLARAVSVAYPIGDVVVLAMLARLMGDGFLRVASMRLLILGAVGLLVADVLYGLILLSGVWNVGGPVDAGWIVFYVAWGAAALHPSMVRLGEFRPRHDLQMGPARVILLASVSLIAPAVLLAESAGNGTVHARTIALFSTVLFLLVIARLWGILGVHQMSVQRERSLRSASEALVSAQGLKEIYQVALDGVVWLTGPDAVTKASIYVTDLSAAAGLGADQAAGAEVDVDVEGGVNAVRCIASSGASGASSAAQGIAAPVADDRHVAWWSAAIAGGDLLDGGTVSVTVVGSERAHRGMLVVEGETPLSLDTHGALSTLAAQVALAVESAKLAQDLLERRNDERFRGILQAASDIIVIVSALGVITYGTPSLGRNLGRAGADAVGRELVEFLHPDDAGEARAIFAAYAAGTSHSQAIADWHLRHHDGTFVAFEVLSSNLLEDPSVAGILLTMRDVSDRRALEVQLKHQAFHDALTGLPNRALFQDRAEHALARTSRHNFLVAMLMLDLDDFKVVNDTRGHRGGDDLLAQVATRLQSVLRAGATVSRFGGDEFAVLVEDLADVAEAERFASRALGVFTTPFILDGEALRIGASVGLVVTGGDREVLDMTGLMRCADLALYAAKDLGKNRVSLYHRDLSTRMLDRLSRRSDLERAMDSGEFLLHYQPIVSIGTGQIVGFEALVRWEHPIRGLVPPLDFISLTEETGLIVPLGAWVLDAACAQLRAWTDAGHGDLRLSVNVSARQLHEKNYVDEVYTALRRHRIPPSMLVLELTESIFALNDPTISDQLTSLRDVGVKIAMDDFGTGYSSLAYLQRFQLDVLKVDKSFVDGLGSDNLDASALVNAIISLAHSLRLEVVAEGIESANQRDELREMGCGLGQGYLFSRPVDAEQITALLEGATLLGSPVAAPAPGATQLPLGD